MHLVHMQVLTGHSVGGAVAMLVTLRLVSELTAEVCALFGRLVSVLSVLPFGNWESRFFENALFWFGCAQQITRLFCITFGQPLVGDEVC